MKKHTTTNKHKKALCWSPASAPAIPGLGIEMLRMILQQKLSADGNLSSSSATSDVQFCLGKKKRQEQWMLSRFEAIDGHFKGSNHATMASSSTTVPVANTSLIVSTEQRQQTENKKNDDGEPNEKHEANMTYEEFMATRKRAPRPGEIGITAEEVANYEAQGYVMSGSTNKGAQRYIDRMQRRMHQKQAEKLRLDHAEEENRRREANNMDHFKKLAAAAAKKDSGGGGGGSK